jgi:hypothetical protein
MRKREKGREEREPEQRRPLERIDPGTRAGVLEQLQQAGGNRAVQEVVAGAQLQRDTTTTTAKPQKPPPGRPAIGSWVLTLDGTVIGPARTVGGFALKGEVVSHVGAGDVVRKRVARTEVEPGVVEVGLGMDKSFYDWVDAALDGTYLRKQLTLHQVDAAGEEQAKVELGDVIVTGVELPQLGADASSPGWLKVRFAAERLRRSAGAGAKIAGKAAANPLDPVNVRLDVSGIGEVKNLEAVEPWAFKLGIQMQQGVAVPGASNLGDLSVTVAEGGNSGFDAWAEDTLLKGKSAEESERTAVLTVAGKDGRKLQLSLHVGIFHADQLARSGGRRYGLYVESAELKVL